MKINVQKSVLVSALKKVSNVISSKSTLAIISNVLLVVENNKMSLHTTDLELSVKTEIDVLVLEDGSITVPCKKLNEIINKLPEGVVEISSTANFQCHIKAGSSNFRILGMNSNEFPVGSAPENPRVFSIEASNLVKNLKKIAYAVSNDDSRYVLNGVLFSIRNGALTTVATDGRRLALVEKTIEDSGDLDGDAVLPMKAVIEIMKSIELDEKVKVSISENKISFVTANTTMISKLVDGNYPNFRHVIPQGFNYSAIIPRTDLIAGIERVSLVISETNQAVKITLNATETVLSSSSAEIGEASETTACDYNGSELEITFNPKFILEPLRTLECDNLTLQINDKTSPIALSGDEGFLYIIMPMRG
ncbi:MAG: DNA polymerase III subunit beta [Lentisphaeria bacterium]